MAERPTRGRRRGVTCLLCARFSLRSPQGRPSGRAGASSLAPVGRCLLGPIGHQPTSLTCIRALVCARRRGPAHTQAQQAAPLPEVCPRRAPGCHPALLTPGGRDLAVLRQIGTWYFQRHRSRHGHHFILAHHANEHVRRPLFHTVPGHEPSHHVAGRHLQAAVQ